MPGDASRGIEVPPVVVQVLSPDAHRECVRTGTAADVASDGSCSCAGVLGGREYYTLISEAVLVTLPIPDASMPFNVLTLVSEISALLLLFYVY